ncbi:MAG: hypothetical protein NTY09_03885 [bacterium]|nr:hypothetical protein [bacterium]
MIAEGYVTGKAYEYLASGRPILSITDGGDLIELIEKSRSGVCVTPSEPGKIADALIDQFNSRNQPLVRNNEYLNRFNRRLLTGELAKLFNDIIARGSNR